MNDRKRDCWMFFIQHKIVCKNAVKFHEKCSDAYEYKQSKKRTALAKAVVKRAHSSGVVISPTRTCFRWNFCFINLYSSFTTFHGNGSYLARGLLFHQRDCKIWSSKNILTHPPTQPPVHCAAMFQGIVIGFTTSVEQQHLSLVAWSKKTSKSDWKRTCRKRFLEQ